MQLNPYLSFNGQCEAAFKFYEQCLGSKINAMMTWGELPDDDPMAGQVSPEWRDKVMHISLPVGNEELMGSDSPPEYYDEPKGFSVSISIDNPAEAERIFKSLAENGTIKMPIGETFWAARFGMLVDQFGIPWMINCDQAT
ncbi:VOC family protein [Romeria aff. gracilis LEGE 07310]|uniref:VOC family protein n=1 Tax=Vasconcelosia minhoensis LEGE 07310 TaxID=915328 RepID=A0A8J7AAC0_9CYAN|nr:VOC family protein [Romeria gracilis]MBE9079075.1 VOC family protein [Romeria aff. gracilis LEGE 07310]